MSWQFFGLGQLGRGLALAFIVVALAAIAVNTAISAATLSRDATVVAMRQEHHLAKAIALAAGQAHSGNGWDRPDLLPVLGIAQEAGAGLRVVDTSGRVVSTSPGFVSFPRTQEQTFPAMGGRQRVGSVTVRFGHRGLGGLAHRLAAQRWHARLISAAIAALIALIVSVVVARAISGPLEALLAAFRARRAGGRSARVTNVRGVGVVRELLESFNRTADTLDEQERLQRDLTANVAHELRTPVAVLQAGHEAMLDGVTALSRDNVESLRDETVRLGRMIENLQRLAAAEAAAVRLKPAWHDLSLVAAEAAADLQDAFAAAGIGLEQRLQPAVVCCDADRIQEVVINLLTNALKFTPPGGEVLLESQPVAGYGGWIRVTDSGIGIAADELPHVTERFYRGPPRPGNPTGSGIGLAVVAALVRAHGGDVQIVSEPGAGTQVRVTLPADSTRNG